MEAPGYWSGMVLGEHDGYDPGLEDFTIPVTQDTYGTFNYTTESPQTDVEVLASRGSGRRSTTKGFSKWTKKFDVEEDKLICSAWLNVSKDPINGANQKHSAFWARIKAYFDHHKETQEERTANSLMHRWLTIQTCVNNFCAAYEHIERRPQSGGTIQDQLNQAYEVYLNLDEEKKKFTLIHCWHKLKDEDKWKTKRKELAALQKQSFKKRKEKTTNDSTPMDVNTNNTEESQEPVAPGSEERKRPRGTKKAKEALKQRGSEACMEALDSMWSKKEAFDREKENAREQRFLASLELEKQRMANEDKIVQAEAKKAEAEAKLAEAESKKAEAKSKKAEADLLKEENVIMMMDMTSLSPLQKQYYETMQKKIVAKRIAEEN